MSRVVRRLNEDGATARAWAASERLIVSADSLQSDHENLRGGAGASVTVAMHDVVESVRSEFPGAIAWIAEELESEVSEFGEPAVQPSRFHQMCEEHFVTVASLLAAGITSDVVVPAAVTRSFARDVFRWRIPLDTLLRLLSVGLRKAWTWWRDVFEDRVTDPIVRTQLISRCTDLLFAYHNVMVSVSVQEYTQIAETSARWMADRRIRIVRRILESPATVHDADLSQRLGYNLAAHHLGFVLWADIPDDTADDDVMLELLQMSRRWFGQVGSASPILLPVDGRTLWAWRSYPSIPRPPKRLPAPRSPLRVAIGQPATGIDGFRVTHYEAQAAREVAQRFNLADRVVRHADIETLSMIASDDRSIRRFIDHKLGPLATNDAHSAELREALRYFLQAGGRIDHAASQVGVHRNTLARRVEKARELLALDQDWAGIALALVISTANPSRLTIADAP